MTGFSISGRNQVFPTEDFYSLQGLYSNEDKKEFDSLLFILSFGG